MRACGEQDTQGQPQSRIFREHRLETARHVLHQRHRKTERQRSGIICAFRKLSKPIDNDETKSDARICRVAPKEVKLLYHDHEGLGFRVLYDL